MISLDELTDLLNAEVDADCITALVELWNEGEPPFNPEHPAIERFLENILEALNEQFE